MYSPDYKCYFGYNVVNRKNSSLWGEGVLLKKKQMAQALLNNQGKDQVEASIQELREAIVEDFPPEVSWSKTELYSQGKKKKNIKKLYREFKRHTVLNPELQNIEIF